MVRVIAVAREPTTHNRSSHLSDSRAAVLNDETQMNTLGLSLKMRVSAKRINSDPTPCRRRSGRTHSVWM
jgi:hypothetical protein